MLALPSTSCGVVWECHSRMSRKRTSWRHDTTGKHFFWQTDMNCTFRLLQIFGCKKRMSDTSLRNNKRSSKAMISLPLYGKSLDLLHGSWTMLLPTGSFRVSPPSWVIILAGFQALRSTKAHVSQIQKEMANAIHKSDTTRYHSMKQWSYIAPLSQILFNSP
jgi:hypothetical protein